jgi:hypothetical protein
MVDYKKFDSIIDSDSDDDTELLTTPSSRTMQQDTNSGTSFEKIKGMTKKGAEGRFKFEHEGNTIYEWEQSLDEVNIYIAPPPGVQSGMIEVDVTHTHVRVGLKGCPSFIDEDTGGPVKVGFNDNHIYIYIYLHIIYIYVCM